MTEPSSWSNRIVDRALVAPETLCENPANFRVHPEAQQRQLRAVLEQIGWVEDVIVNRNSGNLVDGHLRVALAVADGLPEVPVAYVELEEDEEKQVLLSLDAITRLAVTDDAALVGLLDDIAGEPGKLIDWLRDEGRASPRPTQEQIERSADDLENRFRRDTEQDGVDVTCPQCAQQFGIAGIGVTS